MAGVEPQSRQLSEVKPNGPALTLQSASKRTKSAEMYLPKVTSHGMNKLGTNPIEIESFDDFASITT